MAFIALSRIVLLPAIAFVFSMKAWALRISDIRRALWGRIGSNVPLARAGEA